jgi:magnesium transporter
VEAALLFADGSTNEATTASVTTAIGGDGPFWLDISDMDDTGVGWLRELFHIHDLAVEDAEHFGQRPKLDAYDSFVQIVLYGAADDSAESVEVHCLYSEHWLVTVRRGGCQAIEDIRSHAATWRSLHEAKSIMLLYRISDALIDSYFPVLARFDDRIDDLEEAILKQPNEQQLATLFAMKQQLIVLRKLVTPERDMMASLLAGTSELPGMTEDAERYFRDLYDHTIRLSDLVDSYRDLLTSAVDTHLSTVSNRLNEVMKQLAIIATIFLPLSFLTGFFGQNFAWLVARITNFPEFFLLGIGLEALAVVILLRMFRRRGWM